MKTNPAAPAMRVGFACCVALLLSLTALVQGRAQDASERAGDWPYVDHDFGGTRYSALATINTTNAKKLTIVCSYSFPVKEASQTAPIVVAGIIYATSAHYTVALNGSDCRVLWTNRWVARGPEPSTTQRGVAYADGKIVRGTPDDYLLALDAKSGRLLWAKQIADPRQGHFISMPPLVHDGLIYIGPAGSEWAATGWVGAFRLVDGRQIWRFSVVPADGRPGADTWGPNPAGRKHSGGNLWTPMSFDLAKDLLYVPVGNPAPDFYDDGRPGTNLYTNSLIALDAKTGRLHWYKQLVAHDTHDYDLTHVSPVVKTASRTMIMTTGKDGLLRAVDGDTHQVVYDVPFTTRLDADAAVGTTPLRACPGAFGGDEWNGAAYSPKLGLIFAPGTDWCNTINKDKTAPNPASQHAKGLYFGGEMKFDKWGRARGWLTAFDAANGKVAWRYAVTKPLIGAVTSTAGNVVFTGELTGDFLALDARSGKVLYRKNVGGPIGGGVVTYRAGGDQHVAVVSGFVGIFNTFAPTIGGGNPTVTVFRLGHNL